MQKKREAKSVMVEVYNSSCIMWDDLEDAVPKIRMLRLKLKFLEYDIAFQKKSIYI